MITAALLALGITPSAAKWILRGLYALAVVAAFASVYERGFSAGANSVKAKLTQQQLQIEQQRTKRLEQLQADNNRLTIELETAQRADRVVYRTIREKVPHVVKEVVRVPVVAPAAQCSVRNDYVWLWDDATVARVPDTAGSAAHGPARTGDPSADSGVGFSDLLSNHVDNAEIDNEIRRQCTALIEWHRVNDR